MSCDSHRVMWLNADCAQILEGSVQTLDQPQEFHQHRARDALEAPLAATLRARRVQLTLAAPALSSQRTLSIAQWQHWNFLFAPRKQLISSMT